MSTLSEIYTKYKHSLLESQNSIMNQKNNAENIENEADSPFQIPFEDENMALICSAAFGNNNGTLSYKQANQITAITQEHIKKAYELHPDLFKTHAYFRFPELKHFSNLKKIDDDATLYDDWFYKKVIVFSDITFPNSLEYIGKNSIHLCLSDEFNLILPKNLQTIKSNGISLEGNSNVKITFQDTDKFPRLCQDSIRKNYSKIHYEFPYKWCEKYLSLKNQARLGIADPNYDYRETNNIKCSISDIPSFSNKPNALGNKYPNPIICGMSFYFYPSFELNAEYTVKDIIDKYKQHQHFLNITNTDALGHKLVFRPQTLSYNQMFGCHEIVFLNKYILNCSSGKEIVEVIKTLSNNEIDAKLIKSGDFGYLIKLENGVWEKDSVYLIFAFQQFRISTHPYFTSLADKLTISESKKRLKNAEEIGYKNALYYLQKRGENYVPKGYEIYYASRR